jgi:hypothetical protein
MRQGSLFEDRNVFCLCKRQLRSAPKYCVYCTAVGTPLPPPPPPQFSFSSIVADIFAPQNIQEKLEK